MEDVEVWEGREKWRRVGNVVVMEEKEKTITKKDKEFDRRKSRNLNEKKEIQILDEWAMDVMNLGEIW